MNALDYTVLLVTLLGIAAYGMWRTRRQEGLDHYLKGDQNVRWGTIGLSVMATQASAITFLSTPGQAYESGISFVQNYFGLPLALVIVCAVFLPIYRRLKVYTAYEYLGRRFDAKTRLLGASLFLLQRGCAAGITIYAPAIVLSSVLGWRLDLTVLGTGLLVVAYTVSGGNDAVNLTQKWQMGVVFIGMAAAFVVLLVRLPEGVSPLDGLAVAGGLGKLNAVDFSFDVDRRYTIWTGIFGGLFLSLSYFGTDQSQVQRYLSGHSLRESRLGLLFNAIFKIPMQFAILLLGALVFVFYQFERPPVFFNSPAWEANIAGPSGGQLRELEAAYADAHERKREQIGRWLDARESGSPTATDELTALQAAHVESETLRNEAKRVLQEADARVRPKDSDYVFITFVLTYLPHGLIGLLIAVIFAAGLSSTSSELNALGTTTLVDFYRHLWKPDATDAHYVTASKLFTGLWGVVAIGFALFANVVENLIEAVNIIGSIFYGVILGVFLVAFFLRHVRGNAVFLAALVAQTIVLVLFFTQDIGYLWFNLIGCGTCVILSLFVQALFGGDSSPAPADSAAV